ncbi:hypothetical protein NliqN6_5747 [Naganishia liquefaciens]|uniref:Uncharacterized protein n=1 Tax=Naganishia liquefaciens TaxID=104408 RepID=A0A8H3TY43_9TREE|nr:hypothetical protein NliqN6_5747 [Naganishia liquefaciens]
MLRRRSASRGPAHTPTPDPQRPLLSPLLTQFSSPETRYTQSPGSIHEPRSRVTHREPTIEGMMSGGEGSVDERADEPRGRDEEERDKEELGRLASGVDAFGGTFSDSRKSAEFLRHANASLHSLLSRHSTLREHPSAESAAGPSAGSSGYPMGHIVAPGSASSSDFTDIDALKPSRNADDEYIARLRHLFTSPEEQARENERIMGNMHRWMDELVVMQEGIAALHMKLEGVQVDGHEEAGDKHAGVKDQTGSAEHGPDDKGTTPDGTQAREDAKEKREDQIMDEMIDQLHQLFDKLRDFHSSPQPTIAFSSSRTAASAINTAPGTPRASHEDDDKKRFGSSWLSRENSRDGHRVSSPLPMQQDIKHHGTPDAAAVRDTSIKSPRDADHPRQFLRPKQHHDYARGQPPPDTGHSPREIPSPQDPHDGKQTTSDRRTPSRPHPIVTKPHAHHPHAEHADLRRRVLQSQDRRRAESIESLVSHDDSKREGPAIERPGATRTWSTVLEG